MKIEFLKFNIVVFRFIANFLIFKNKLNSLQKSFKKY